MTPSPQTLLEFALDAAWQAGRITLRYFQTGVAAERKADNSPVTVADRAAEQTLREQIGRYWPDHAILGEEYGRSETASRYTWVLDPIDGTKSFISGVPLYSTLVALLDGDEAVLGVAHFPALNDTIYALRGGGCFWNGRRAHVSKTDQLADAVLLASGFHFKKFGVKAVAWERLVDAAYIARTWGDAYGYFLVATGRADVMVDPALSLWDAAPLRVILEEAGGAFTDWAGEPTIHHEEGIGCNGALLEEVLAVIRE